MSDDWSWNGEDGEMCTVIPRTMATAVYTNQKDEVVIRQEAWDSQDEDKIVVIPKDKIGDLISALQSVTTAE